MKITNFDKITKQLKNEKVHITKVVNGKTWGGVVEDFIEGDNTKTLVFEDFTVMFHKNFNFILNY